MKIKPIYLIVTALFTASALSGQATFSTDRLGYSGTAVKYDTQFDLDNKVNAVDTVNFSDRDAALFFEDGSAAIAMGSWWYTTDPGGSPGFGNTNGNTGTGFMQLFDDDFSSVDSFSMVFDGFDGTNWTEANLSVAGSDAPYSDDFSRFSLPANTGDSGEFLSYELDIAVGGLAGMETSPGWVEASNHPTSVTGTMRAIFHNTAAGSAQNGFFDIELTFNLDNWAYANRNELTGDYSFADSYFAATPVPEPATVGILGVGLLSALLYVRRRFGKR